MINAFQDQPIIGVEMPDFYSIELVKDSNGKTEVNPSFRTEFANSNDSRLGASAPTNMYIATTLGQ